MALNMDLVGTPLQAIEHDYTWRDAVLYALGVGATADELDFLYEGRGPKVLPTFAVVPAFRALLAACTELRAPLAKILHGEQTIRLHRPIPPSGTLKTVAEVSGVYDKGKGALAVITLRTTDADGTPLFDNVSSIFVRGEGGFGGDRGPGALEAAPPEGAAPSFSDTERTRPEQAALYRLSGDLNPLHIDPDLAGKAGFERPILHGLCTYGFAGRAIVRGACGGDPARLRSFAGRFSGVVLPGDELTTTGWDLGDGRYAIRVTTQDGTTVLSNSLAEIAPAK
jgi:acyl dehydratase